MTYNRPSEKRILIGNIAILSSMFGLAIALWNEYSWYEVLAPFGTLVTFVALIVAFFAYVDINYAIKDPACWMMGVASIIALVNLFIVHSGKGAFLTAFDVLMMLYLANKVVFPDKWLYVCYGFMGFFFFYWTIDVKGYFKGYNTNYGGLILITGFVFAMIGFEHLRIYLKEIGKEKLANWMYLLYAIMFFVGYKIIAWYRARCAFLGFLVFILILILPGKIWNKKALYAVPVLGVVLGPIAFSGLYIWMSKMSDVFTIRLFYKDAISGRNEVWKELWTAFLQKPITGIGSSYEMHIDWLGGMFEVHSGMLDILFVHGIIVFVAVAAFLINRLFRLREAAAISTTGKFIMGGAMAILASSFLENFFIVSPFTVALFVLLAAGNKSDIID